MIYLKTETNDALFHISDAGHLSIIIKQNNRLLDLNIPLTHELPYQRCVPRIPYCYALILLVCGVDTVRREATSLNFPTNQVMFLSAPHFQVISWTFCTISGPSHTAKEEGEFNDMSWTRTKDLHITMHQPLPTEQMECRRKEQAGSWL